MAKPGLGARAKALGRSISFGAIEMLEDYNPAVNKLYQTNKEYVGSVKDVLRDIYRGQMSITKSLNAINPQLAKTYGLVKEGIAGIPEDVRHTMKTGEVRGLTGRDTENTAKDMLDKAGYSKDDLDMGFEDMDLSMDDLNWDDLDAKPSKSSAGDIQDKAIAKSTAAEVAAINKGTEVTAFVGAKLASGLQNVTSSIGSQTKALSGEFTRANKINVKLTNSMIMAQASMLNKTNATLKMINDNLANMVSFNNDTHLKYAQASMEYYDKSLGELTKIREAVERGFPVQKAKENKDFLNDPYTVIGLDDGTLDLGAYFKQALTNFTEQTDIGMALKTGWDMIVDNPEMVADFFKDPMKQFVRFAMDEIVPTVLKTGMQQFNRTLESFLPAAIAKLADMGDNADNPFLQAIGNIFGIRVERQGFKLNNYERGPVPFDGITRKAIVDTIPTLLTKIHSALTGGPERHMDYETGRWVTTDEIRDSYRSMLRNARQNALGDSAEWIDKIKEIVVPESKEQREQIASATELIKEYLAGGHGNEYSFNNFNNEEFLDSLSSMISEKMGGITNRYNDDLTRGFVETFRRHMMSLDRVAPDVAMQAGAAKARANTWINRMMMQEAANPNSMMAKLFSGFDDRTSREDIRRLYNFRNGNRFTGEPGWSMTFDGGMMPPGMFMFGGFPGGPGGNPRGWEARMRNAAYARAYAQDPFTASLRKNQRVDRVSGEQWLRGYSWTDDFTRLNTGQRQAYDQALEEERLDYLRSGTPEQQAEYRRIMDMRKAQRMHDRDVVRAGRMSGKIGLDITSSDSAMNKLEWDEGMRRRTHSDDRKKWKEYTKQLLSGSNTFKQVNEWDTEDRDSLIYRWIKRPSEIISDALASLEHSMYTVLFGIDNEQDESVLQVLTSNIKTVFADVRDWVGKEIVHPLKKLIFGDDAIGTVSDMAKKGYYSLLGENGVWQETLGELHNISDATIGTVASYFKGIQEGRTNEYNVGGGASAINAKGQSMASRYNEIKAAYDSYVGEAGMAAKTFTDWLRTEKDVKLEDKDEEDAILEYASAQGHKSSGGLISQAGNYILGAGELVIPKQYAQKVMASLSGMGITLSGKMSQWKSKAGPRMGNVLGGLFSDTKAGGGAAEEGAYASNAFNNLITAIYSLASVMSNSISVQEETVSALKAQNVASGIVDSKMEKRGSYASRLTRLINKVGQKSDVRSVSRLQMLRGWRDQAITRYGSKAEQYSSQISELQADLDSYGSYLDLTPEQKAEYDKKKKKLDLLQSLESKNRGRKQLLENQVTYENTPRPVEAAKMTMKEGASQVVEGVKTGIGKIMGVLMGDENFDKKQVIDENLKAMRAAMPKTLAQTIAGTIGLTALGSHLGLLGALIGPAGPVGAALISGAVSIAHQSETFKDFVYGKMDATTGERNGGLVPDALKQFWRENKTGILGGGIIGGLGAITGLGPLQIATSILSGLPGAGVVGFLPGLALGITGPVIAGAAAGAAIHSKKFREIVFGSFDADGNKISEDVIDKVKKALPVGLAGAGVGALGAGALSSLGLLGMLSIGPWTGAILGGAVGLATAADGFKEFWFGKKDDKGLYEKAGMFQIAKGFLNYEIFEPMKSFLAKRFLQLEHFVETGIIYPLAEAFTPFKTLALSIKDTTVELINDLGNKITNELDFIFRPIKNFVTSVAETAKNTVRNLFDIATSLMGAVISAPFRLLGMTGNMLGGVQRIFNSKYDKILADEKNKREAWKQGREAKYKQALADWGIKDSEMSGKRTMARRIGYGEMILSEINSDILEQQKKAEDAQKTRDEERDELLRSGFDETSGLIQDTNDILQGKYVAKPAEAKMKATAEDIADKTIGRDKELTREYGLKTAEAIREEAKEAEYKDNVVTFLSSMNERLGVISANTGKEPETLWGKLKNFIGPLLGFLGDGIGKLFTIAGGIGLIGGVVERIYNFITAGKSLGGDGSYHDEQLNSHFAHRFASSSLGKNMIRKGLFKGATIRRSLQNWSRSFGREGAELAAREGAEEVVERGGGTLMHRVEHGTTFRMHGPSPTRAAEEIVEDGLEHAGAAGLKEAGERGSRDLIGKFKDFVSKALDKISKSKKLRNLMGVGVFETFCKSLHKAVKSVSQTALVKGYAKIMAKMGKGAANQIAAHTGLGLVLTAGFAIYDAGRGWIDTAQMFGVNAQDVTYSMRQCAAIYNAVAGLPYIWPIDLILEIGFQSGKRKLLTLIYEAMGFGSAAEITELQAIAEEGYQKWEQEEGNQGKSFNDYLKAKQDDQFDAAVKHMFGEGAGEFLVGRKNEQGKLEQHGLVTAAEGAWQDTKWYEIPYAVPKLVIDTTRRWLFGGNYNGEYAGGLWANQDTPLGKILSNSLVTIFGEAATENYQGSVGIIGRWAQRISDIWDTGLLESLEKFKIDVDDQINAYGPLHGMFNIITNGIFGYEMNQNPWANFWKAVDSFTSTIGAQLDSLKQRFVTWFDQKRNMVDKALKMGPIDAIKYLVTGEDPTQQTSGVSGSWGTPSSGGPSKRRELSQEEYAEYNEALRNNSSVVADEFAREKYGEYQNSAEYQEKELTYEQWKDKKYEIAPYQDELRKREEQRRLELAKKYGQVLKDKDGKTIYDPDAAQSGFGGFFNQRDKRWASKALGFSQYGNMGDIGCGPTALATALSMEGKSGVTPMDTLRQVRPEDLGTSSRGVTASYFPKAAHAMGSEFYPINPTDPKAVGKALKSGYPVIAGGKSGNAGPFTQAGHWNVFRGLGKGGITQSFDPLGRRRPGAPVSVGSVMGGVAGARGGMMGVIAPKGKSGFGGNTLKMNAQEGSDCTLHATAAMENAYLGTDYSSTDFGFGDWWNSIKTDLSAQDYGFDTDEGPKFVNMLESHFKAHPNWPILLYQTGGLKNGPHELNRGSGNHATVVGRLLPNGNYQVFDSNGGVTHELAAGEIFDPDAKGGDQGMPYGEGNSLVIPGIGPSQEITTWTATGGPYDGQSSGTERAVQRTNPSGVANKPRYMGLMDKLRALGGKYANIGRAYMEARLTGGDLNAIYQQLEANNGTSSSGSYSFGPTNLPNINFDMQTGGQIAQAIAGKTGLPPELIWAQMYHETGGFTSDLVPYHNYGGVKYAETTTKPSGLSWTVTGEDSRHHSYFKDDNSFIDYMSWYYPLYEEDGLLQARNARDWAAALKRGGYYTDDENNYANSIQTILDEHASDMSFGKSGMSGLGGWFGGDSLYGLGGGPDMSHDMPYNTPMLDTDGYAHAQMLDAIRSLDLHPEAGAMISILSAIRKAIEEGGFGDGLVTVGNRKMTRAEANALKHPPQVSALNGTNGKKFSSATYESIHAKNIEIASGGEFASA